MSDANREIGVKITTSADLAAAQAANKEIQQTGKVTEKAGQAAGEATGKKLKLKDAVKGLALEFPGLAHAIKLVTNPLALTTAALAAGVAAWQAWTQKLAEAGRKQSELQALGLAAKSFARYLADVKESGAEFQVALDVIASNSKNAATEMERLNGALRKQKELQDEMEDIQLATEKAKLQERHEADPVKFPRSALMEATAAADERSRKRRAGREIDTRAQEIENIKKGIAAEDKIIGGYKPNDAEVARLRKEAKDQADNLAEAEQGFKKVAPDLQEQILKQHAREVDLKGNEHPLARFNRGEAVYLGRQAQKKLDRETKLLEDRQRASDAAAQRLKEVEESRDLGKDRVRGSAQRKETLQRQLTDMEAEQERRKKFLGESIPAQSEAEKAKAAAERAKEQREKREKTERDKNQQEDKLNKAADEEKKKEEMKEFRRKRGDFGGVEQMNEVLSYQAELMAAMTEVADAHNERLRILEQRIADVAANV